MKALEKQLDKAGGKFVTGDQLTLADFVLCSQMQVEFYCHILNLAFYSALLQISLQEPCSYWRDSHSGLKYALHRSQPPPKIRARVGWAVILVHATFGHIYLDSEVSLHRKILDLIITNVDRISDCCASRPVTTRGPCSTKLTSSPPPRASTASSRPTALTPPRSSLKRRR